MLLLSQVPQRTFSTKLKIYTLIMVCHQNDKIRDLQLADEPSCIQEVQKQGNLLILLWTNLQYCSTTKLISFWSCQIYFQNSIAYNNIIDSYSMIVSTFTTNSQFTYSKHIMEGKRENRLKQTTQTVNCIYKAKLIICYLKVLL